MDWVLYTVATAHVEYYYDSGDTYVNVSKLSKAIPVLALTLLLTYKLRMWNGPR